jgi:excisionase family DNA binding protein
MQRIANKQTLAQLFGVHDATIMRWVREKRLPAPFTLKPRGRVLFDLDEVDAFLAARKQECASALGVAQ